jgi:two-component system response regulator YesN
MGLLGRIKRHAVKEARKPTDKETQRKSPTASYAKLNEILQRRLTESVPLQEVAELLGESPSAISHRLKRKFGMNYSEYVGRLRVDKAKEILRRTKLSATEVAHRVGYSDQSNFTKQFKKFEGHTPIDYRNKFSKGAKRSS